MNADKPIVNSKKASRQHYFWLYGMHMIHEPELIALEQRAHAARITMPDLCKLADKHPQSWYRARKRGRADYSLIKPLEDAMTAVERQSV